jgi:hypothetical protein
MKRYRCPKHEQLEELLCGECPFCGFKGVMSHTEPCYICGMWLSYCSKCQQILCIHHKDHITEGERTYSLYPYRDTEIEEVTGRVRTEWIGNKLVCLVERPIDNST